MYWEDCELFGGTSFIFYCHVSPLGIQMALSLLLAFLLIYFSVFLFYLDFADL